MAELAHPGESGEFLRVRFALRDAELDVAAEDRLPALGEAGHDGSGERADAGQSEHAEEQADGEEAKPGEAAAQVAQREAEG
jgi:hypothetical protein